MDVASSPTKRAGPPPARRLRRDDVRDALLQPYRRLALGGAAIAGAAALVAWAFELRPWLETLLRSVLATGLVCVASLVAVPLRLRRQRRWAALAPRGDAPNWSALVPRLHRTRRISWVLLVIAWLLAATAARSSAAVTERYELLALRAERVRGEVVEVHHASRGLDWMRVTFVLAERNHETKIVDIPDRFAVGDDVVVLVDPHDVQNATVEGVERSTAADRVLQTFAIIGCLICGVLAFLGVRRSSVAGDALLATGVRKSDAWWRRSRHGYRLLRPGGEGRGIEIGMAVLGSRPLERASEPVRVAGPERGPLVLLDGAGFVGVVRRPLVPRRDLRRLIGLQSPRRG